MNERLQVMIDAYLEDPDAFNAGLDARTREGGVGRIGRIKVGTNVLIRTVTYHYVGRLAYVDGTTLGLDDACWYNTTGDWKEALSSGELASVEHYPDKCKAPDIRIMSIVEIVPWIADLPAR